MAICYIERSSNHKNLELTFAKAESRKELLKFLFDSAAGCSSSPSEPVANAMDTDNCSLDTQLIRHANSIEQAKQKYGNLNITEPILVGGKKSLLLHSHLIPNLQFNANEIVGTACRRVVFLNCMHSKTLKQYRTGESVLFAAESSCEVVCITDLFAIRHSGQEHLFIRGEKYTPLPGNPIHAYSSHQVVQPTSSVVVYPIGSLSRKVILYPDPDNLDCPSCYVVIDYERPQIPLEQNDVIIPAYPLAGDMVLVRDDDLWHAHVISVNYRNKYCQVVFYVQDDSCPGRYKKETLCCSASRSVREDIHWDSIVRQACGDWEGVFWREYI